MIPIKSETKIHDGLQGKEISFGVGDPRWVMKSLADLYSDITLAVIREYSTNGRDANVMAGKANTPIRVTLPTEFSPNFVIEDDGPGMDEETFTNVYTQFGISNKRDTNDANGMLGFGSKSGAAYTNNFQVRSVKDGMKIDGVVIRKPDWSITLKILSHQKTNESNGTRITIPVHNIEEFRSKAETFYSYWPKDSVLVGGKEPKRVELGLEVVEGTFLSNDYRSGVVMGNVFYPIHNPNAIFNHAGVTLQSNMDFIHYAENGSVEFVPSREALNFTDQTMDYLSEVVTKFATELASAANEEIQAADTASEALRCYDAWHARFGTLINPIWRGKDMPRYRHISSNHHRYFPSYNSWSRARSYESPTLPHSDVSGKNIVVYGFNNVFNTRYGKMVTDHFNDKRSAQGNFNKVGMVAFFPGNIDDYDAEWVDTTNWFEWDSLKKEIKPPATKVKGSSNRTPGSWDYVSNGKMVIGQELVEDAEVFYLETTTTLDHESVWETISILRKEGGNADEFILVKMPKNRKQKFLREDSDAKEGYGEMVRLLTEDIASLIDNPTPEVYDWNYYTKKRLESLDPAKVADPILRDAVRKAQEPLAEANPRLEKRLAMMRNVRLHSLAQKNSGPEDSVVGGYEPESDYQLWGRLPYSHSEAIAHEDTYLYLNSKYHNEVRFKRG